MNVNYNTDCVLLIKVNNKQNNCPGPDRLSYFLTSAALVGKLLLKAGHTEVTGVFGDKGLGSYWLPAPVALEAGLVPAAPLVVHFARTWRTTRRNKESFSQHAAPG